MTKDEALKIAIECLRARGVDPGDYFWTAADTLEALVAPLLEKEKGGVDDYTSAQSQ